MHLWKDYKMTEEIPTKGNCKFRFYPTLKGSYIGVECYAPLDIYCSQLKMITLSDEFKKSYSTVQTCKCGHLDD